MESINKSHQFAVDLFAEECKKRIGIKPLEDDKLILKSAIDFRTYIETYKRLDHTVDWHLNMIRQQVKSKVDTLLLRINKEYGTVQEYINGVQQRSRPSRRAYERNTERTGQRTKGISFRS